MTLAQTIVKGAENIPAMFFERVVGQAQAQHRADVCLKCPLHVQGNLAVGEAAKLVKKLVELKNMKKLRVHGEHRLQSCSVCSCAMRLKIWQPHVKIMEQTTQDELASFWDQCWIRKEAQ